MATGAMAAVLAEVDEVPARPAATLLVEKAIRMKCPVKQEPQWLCRSCVVLHSVLSTMWQMSHSPCVDQVERRYAGCLTCCLLLCTFYTRAWSETIEAQWKTT